jgi:putative oxidoreductase
MSQTASRAELFASRSRPRQPVFQFQNRPGYVNRTLLFLRLIVGLLFVGHGLQKLVGWFGGPGMAVWTQSVAKDGLQPAAFWAAVEAWGEFGAGLFLVFGLLTPLAASFIVADMLVAILKVHAARGLWSQSGGYEYNLVLIGLMLGLGFMGPGLYSLDGRLPFRLIRPAVFLPVLAVSVAAVGYVLLGFPVPF